MGASPVSPRCGALQVSRDPTDFRPMVIRGPQPVRDLASEAIHRGCVGRLLKSLKTESLSNP